MQTLRKHSIWSVYKHYGNIVFWMFSERFETLLTYLYNISGEKLSINDDKWCF